MEHGTGLEQNNKNKLQLKARTTTYLKILDFSWQLPVKRQLPASLG